MGDCKAGMHMADGNEHVMADDVAAPHQEGYEPPLDLPAPGGKITRAGGFPAPPATFPRNPAGRLAPLADEGEDEKSPDRNRRYGGGLTRRRRELVERMIFDGLDRKSAAAACKMSDRNARMAMNSPAVMSFYRQQLALLRESERPKSIHKLAELRDQGRSLKVSFEAARELAREDEGTRIAIGVNVNIQPGYIVDCSRHSERAREILAAAGGRPKVIDAEPLREGERG